MGRLKGICISEKRGTEKHEVREAMVKMDWGCLLYTSPSPRDTR